MGSSLNKDSSFWARFFCWILLNAACSDVNSLELDANIKNGCLQVKFGDPLDNRIACKCDETHCDSINFQWPTSLSHMLKVESNKLGDRFASSLIDLNSSHYDSAKQTDAAIIIELNKYNQQVLGYGGSLTDTSAENILGLPDKLRQSLLRDFYSASEGCDYNLLRTSIGGSDFSRRPYTLADSPDGSEDFELNNFRLQREDLEFKLPMLKMIKQERSKNCNLQASTNSLLDRDSCDDLKIFAASWSPPAWIKTNNNLVRGQLKQGDKYKDVYARYLIKFLKAYKQQNVSIFSLSTGNEPQSPILLPDKINFNSLEMDPWEFVSFVGDFLIPQLIKNNYTAEDVNLLLFDDNSYNFEIYQRELFANPLIRQYAKGLGVHWYAHGWKNIVPYSILAQIRQHTPQSIWTLSTEASFIGKPMPGSWERAAKYARDIIENLQYGYMGWIDWNMALNMTGGYTWVDNNLDATILISDDNKYYVKNPLFYAIAHFSRFITKNSDIVPTYVRSLTSILMNNNTLNYNNNSNLTTTNLLPLPDIERIPRGVWPPNKLFEEDISVNNEEILRNGGIFAIAAELPKSTKLQKSNQIARRLAIVVLNTNLKPKMVRFEILNCKSLMSKQNYKDQLFVELSSDSLTSFALNC